MFAFQGSIHRAAPPVGCHLPLCSVHSWPQGTASWPSWGCPAVEEFLQHPGQCLGSKLKALGMFCEAPDMSQHPPCFIRSSQGAYGRLLWGGAWNDLLGALAAALQKPLERPSTLPCSGDTWDSGHWTPMMVNLPSWNGPMGIPWHCSIPDYLSQPAERICLLWPSRGVTLAVGRKDLPVSLSQIISHDLCN